MKRHYLTLSLILLSFTAVIFAACSPTPSPGEGEDIATQVAQTLEAAEKSLDTPATSEATATSAPTETPSGDLQPLSPDECEQLAGFMINRTFIPPVEQSTVAVERQDETGFGCQAVGVGDGAMFPDMMVLEEAMGGILGELGWTEDPTAPACLGTGGWGPGASSSCFTQADAFCELFIHIDPIDKALCSDDEPINSCFEKLQPEQLIYTAEITCARDLTPDPRPLESELTRITFETGAIQAQILGEVAAGGIDHYVLYAMEGQEMTVNLLDRSDETIPNDTAVLVIWGTDGSVLISSHADALSWVGELPSTQDYFIDVKSISDRPIPYTLQVIIPPGQVTDHIEYQNPEYGFKVTLPSSWEGFSIQTINWEGYGSGDEDYPTGPLISIVHPESTLENPRQAIPIMVFTIEEWDQLQNEEWHVSAAPINPSELGRNSQYVFGLPPRYNYAYLTGWEEVELIIQGDSLETFEPGDTP